jgi:hypothetical protein
MATLILTAIGTVLGGPIGAAIGAAIGQQVDRKLFAPKARSGPRLSDLSIQTSSYGAAIPKIFGTARVSGTVIWSTDLVETREKVKTGKGQPKQTVYSYAASFAVALSGRPIRSIGRIWADGKLLRGAAGDFKSPATLRTHLGTPGQGADPLILSAEGASQTPAYRGMAYVVFEDFQLGDFGNRIPSLSFEVVADDAPVSIGAMATSLAEGRIVADCPSMLDGIAVTGTSLRGVLETLSPAIPLFATSAPNGLLLREAGGDLRTLDAAHLGAAAGTERRPRIQRERLPDGGLPRSLTLTYSDPGRDYQPGAQRSWRNHSGRQEEQVELPAHVTPTAARMFAERALSARWLRRDNARISLPWGALDVRAGDRVICPGLSGTWRVRKRTLEQMVIHCDLELLGPGMTTTLEGDGGRPVSEPDATHGPTVLHLLDIPSLTSGIETAPHLLVAASGPQAGWRRAALSFSLDQGVSWSDAGITALPATLGRSVTPLADGPSSIIDQTNSVTVSLTNPGDALTGTDMAGLLAGQNLAALGQELFQFLDAEPRTGGTWRLSGLLRGRRGTEWATATHILDEPFTLIEAETLLTLPMPIQSGRVDVMAIGVGDDTPSLDHLSFANMALLPPSPVRITTHETPGGDVDIRWTRRSRAGWAWPDQVEAPLAEENERYRIDIMPQPGFPRSVETSVPLWTYSSAQRAADIASGASQLSIAIRQIGTHGLSQAALIQLALS